MHRAYATARRLRLQGKSYNEITRLCNVSKSSLSIWFRDLSLPSASRVRLAARVREGTLRGLLERNRRQTALAQQRHQAWRSAAERQVGRCTRRDLWIIGIGLYLGEGTKRGPGHEVRFANSDPAIIRCMMRFFREICGVQESKFRLAVHAYDGMDISAIERYWMQVTGIPNTQVQKTYLGVSRASTHRRSPHRLPFGTAHIKISDTALFHRIMGWIDGVHGSIGMK